MLGLRLNRQDPDGFIGAMVFMCAFVVFFAGLLCMRPSTTTANAGTLEARAVPSAGALPLASGARRHRPSGMVRRVRLDDGRLIPCRESYCGGAGDGDRVLLECDTRMHCGPRR